MGLLKIFKIPLPPFKFADPMVGLKGVCELLYAIISGGKCIGYQEILVSDVALSELSIPEGTVYALLILEADTTYGGDKSRLVRYKQFDTELNPPSDTIGMPIGDLGVLEIKDFENLKGFKAIGIQVGYTHTLRVEYYG